MNTSLLPLIRLKTGPQVIRRPESAAPACPFCHSREVQRLSRMIATATPLTDTGTADRSQRGYSMGIFKDPSSAGLAAQARRMAPSPVPKGTRVFLVALIVLGVGVVGMSLMGKAEPGYGIFAAVMAVVAALSFVQCKSDEQAFAARMKRWDNSWCCLRCGRSFMS